MRRCFPVKPWSGSNRKWFHFAGNKDPLNTIKLARDTDDDSTFIERFLSPQLMRYMGLFAIESDPNADYDEVVAIHDWNGFNKIREILANSYKLSEHIPTVKVHDRQEMSDHCLVLHHHMVNGNQLEEDNTNEILKHIHKQTQFPVVLESVDEDGKVVETFSSPPNYDYKAHRKPKALREPY
jgi:stage V sporulation protein R